MFFFILKVVCKISNKEVKLRDLNGFKINAKSSKTIIIYWKILDKIIFIVIEYNL